MDATPTHDPRSPWHAGELTLQRSVGVVDRMAGVGQRQMARDYMPDQHREFYAQLPFVVLGAVDQAGDVWATLRAGRPGFMRSTDPRRLLLDLPRDPRDPAEAGMEDGAGVGMLGIELHTRRRNRLNGIVRRSGDTGFQIEPTQAYGNCPQYIPLRRYEFAGDEAGAVNQMARLDARARALIAAADSFFVASYVERDGLNQVDVSHRGGKPGFVRIAEDDTLTVPDFSGNLFFNTLGNFLVNPRAGLVFVDFRNGDLLQLTGSAEVILDSPEIAAFKGAERLWRVKPRHIVYRPAALPLRWVDMADGASPNSAITGSWEDAAARLKAARLAHTWRPFRIERVVDESATVRSFYLQPADDAGMPHMAAGQHLPIRLTSPPSETPLIRTYTLSNAPGDGFLRISVKRDGLFSRHLHDALKPGDLIEARAPDGAFTIDATARRPAVLLAAGIGITPMLAMARHLLHEGARTRYQRPAWLFQSARDKAQRPFGDEIAELVGAGQGKLRHVRILSDFGDAERGKDYDFTGRIDLDLLKTTLSLDDYDFYLCGPGSFMQDLYDALRGMNVPDARIHAEAFGPSSIRRRPGNGAAPASTPAVPASTTPVPIRFMSSAKEARWSPDSGTLLELAEQRGLSPEFSCRTGSCGTCRTRVLSGAVAHLRSPTATVGPDEALICSAVPAEGCDALYLDL